MKGKRLEVAAAVAAVALCMLAAACQVQDANGSSETAMGAAEKRHAEVEVLGDDVSDGEETASSAGAEEWAGQAEGHIGPNGEGSLSGADSQSDQEYSAAVEAAKGGWEQGIDLEWVDDSPQDGAPYAKGMLNIGFFKTCSEKNAHEIVESLGGIWVRDSYIFANELDWASALVQFPDCDTYDKLSEMASEVGRLQEVKFVELETTMADDGRLQPVSVSSVQQAYLYRARFRHAWDVV